MLFPISKGGRKEDLAQAARLVLPRILNELVAGLTGHIMADLDGLRYLGPLRSYPPRHLAFSQQEGTNWFAGGGYAWDVVRRDERIRKLVNEWLSSTDRLQTPYRIECQRLLALEEATESAEGELERHIEGPVLDRSYISERYEQGKPTGEHEEVVPLDLVGADTLSRIVARGLTDVAEANAIDDLVMIDERTSTRVTHRDVGAGISQVLPVLVSAYAAEKHLVAIEQPEIHLHPKLQAELGDVFIQSALERGNTFILETHSEHLILRLLRRIRETTGGRNSATPAIRPADISLLYVKPDAQASTFMELRVDERGRLLDPLTLPRFMYQRE